VSIRWGSGQSALSVGAAQSCAPAGATARNSATASSRDRRRRAERPAQAASARWRSRFDHAFATLEATAGVRERCGARDLSALLIELRADDQVDRVPTPGQLLSAGTPSATRPGAHVVSDWSVGAADCVPACQRGFHVEPVSRQSSRDWPSRRDVATPSTHGCRRLGTAFQEDGGPCTRCGGSSPCCRSPQAAGS